jgi:hypothetical protein
MGYSLVQYFFTANVVAQNQNIWPPSSQVFLSPTILCFTVGLMSTVFSMIILTAYIFWGTDSADKWDRRRDIFMKVGGAIKIVLTAVAAAQMSKSKISSTAPFSLYDLTCNTNSQQEFLNIVNLAKGCDYQV